MQLSALRWQWKGTSSPLLWAPDSPSPHPTEGGTPHILQPQGAGSSCRHTRHPDLPCFWGLSDPLEDQWLFNEWLFNVELLGLQANDKGRASVSQGLKIKSNFGSYCRRRMCLVNLSRGCGARGGGAAVAAELSAERTEGSRKMYSTISARTNSSK